MASCVLSFKPAIPGFGNHDPGAAVFGDGRLVFGVEEEERYTRRKPESTRSHTVTEERDERYRRLIPEFEEVTGVPVLLSMSFNDRAEPIVTRPTEAVKDFFGMGIDLLVLGDVVFEK